MNTPTAEQPSGQKPIVKYTMMSFYFLFVGFCAAGIYLKWNLLTNNALMPMKESLVSLLPFLRLIKGQVFLSDKRGAARERYHR